MSRKASLHPLLGGMLLNSAGLKPTRLPDCRCSGLRQLSAGDGSERGEGHGHRAPPQGLAGVSVCPAVRGKGHSADLPGTGPEADVSGADSSVSPPGASAQSRPRERQWPSRLPLQRLSFPVCKVGLEQYPPFSIAVRLRRAGGNEIP